MTQHHADRQTVVFLHSLGTDARMWRSQVAAMADAYNVLALEAPGHGSTPWIPGLTSADWVDEIRRQVTEFTTQPVHLVGLSMGGIQAVATAARHPEFVRSLTVANSFAALDTAAAEDRISAIRKGITDQGMDGYAETYLDVTLIHPTSGDTRAELRSAIAGMSPEAYIGSAEATFRADNSGMLSVVVCPTQILAGEHDQKTPLRLAEALQAGIPGAELHVVPDAGHLSNIDAPVAFTDALCNFLARTASTTFAVTAS